MIGAHQLPTKHVSTRGLRIPLEIGLQVEIGFSHLDFLLKSEMIGMLQDHYLIISKPQELCKLTEMVGEDHRIIVQYIHKGRGWMFKSQLLKTLESPYELLFLEYPGVLHYHELREAKRSSIFIPCTFHQPSEAELYGVLIDMSTTGGLCQIKRKANRSAPSISVNTKILLRCLMPGIKEEQKLNGMVRNVTTSDSETKIGIEFENLQPHLRDTISSYLFSIEELAE